jgi:hypothetical protein
MIRHSFKTLILKIYQGLGLSLILSLGLIGTADAANRYVRQGATGNGSGSDWTNAYTTLPTPLVRGDTYYIADGTYGGYTFNVAGTNTITIKKATVADHGTEIGWSNAYGDGQAIFTGSINVNSGYLTFDGVVGGGPGSWTSGHGFLFTSNAGTSNRYFEIASGVTNLTVRRTAFIQVGNVNATTAATHAFYNASTVNNSLFEYNYINNIGGLPWLLRGGSGNIIQYNYTGDICGMSVADANQHCEAIVIHSMSDMHFRWNYIAESPSSGGFVKNNTPTSDSIRIYGNVFANGYAINCNSGPCTNWRIFNNTFQNTRGQVGGDGGQTGLLLYNNIIYNASWAPRLPGSHDYNWYSVITQTACNMLSSANENVNKNFPGSCDNVTTTTNPFVNSSGNNPEDWRLSSAIVGHPGTNVCALDACTGEKKYNLDAFGMTRGSDGAWDRGAYEYASGAGDTTPPSTPANLSATAVSSTQINLSWTASTDNVGIAGYDIRRCSGSGCTPSSIVHSTTGIGTTWNNTGLSASTLYRYDVRARDTSGNPSPSYSTIAEATTSAPAQVTVTPSERINPNLGSIVPSSPQSVTEGQTTQFTVTPDSGYQAIVGGTCGGNLVGETYTTNVITSNCSVIVDYLASICTLQPESGAVTYGIATQSNTTFTYRYSVTPAATTHDIVVGHVNGDYTSYDSYLTRARFRPTGVVDAGGPTSYSALNVFNYQIGVQYDVRMVVNLPAGTYSMWVAPAGGEEVVIAQDLGIQNTQAGVTTVDRAGVAVSPGTTTGAYVCLTGLETEGDTTPPSVTIATADPSNISADSLTVTGSASDAVGVDGCRWRRTSAPDADNGTACTGTTSFSCETSGYAEGANTLYVGCYDAAGNYGSDSITVNLDSVIPEAPVLSALLPASGTKLAQTATTTTIGVTTSIAATCRWGNRLNLLWANLVAYTTTGGTSHSSALAVVAGGVYQICSRCYDAVTELFSSDSCTNFSVTPKPKFRVGR